MRARYGDHSVGPYTSTLSADATPELAGPPQNIHVEPTADGFTVTWDPPTGANTGMYSSTDAAILKYFHRMLANYLNPFLKTGSIVEYNIIYWDWYYTDCEFISGAAFTSSPAVITGLHPGKNYLIAPVTWNQNGQGIPASANNAVPGAGTPPIPTDLDIISKDPTSVQYVASLS